MAKLSIKSLPLIGVVLLVSTVIFFLIKSDREDIGERIIDEIIPAVGISTESFKVTQGDADKGTTWILEADKGSYSEKDDEEETVLLERFRVKFQQKDGFDLELEGKNGKYNSVKNEIGLSGHIKGKTSNGYMFYTEHLMVNLKENNLKTDEGVDFIGPFFRVTGKGLFIDMEKEKLEILKDVISTFDKESLTI